MIVKAFDRVINTTDISIPNLDRLKGTYQGRSRRGKVLLRNFWYINFPVHSFLFFSWSHRFIGLSGTKQPADSPGLLGAHVGNGIRASDSAITCASK